MIPKSGWALSPRYAEFDAELKFGVGGHLQVQESAECHAGGEVLQGLLKPTSARHSAPAVRPPVPPRWAPRWCPVRERARRITNSGGWGGPLMSNSVGIDPSDWVCPLPLRETKRIVLGHGGGGIFLSEELIENLFLPAFGSDGGPARDSAVLAVAGGRIALTTDSYVVNPLFFPGGNIGGDLAVNGTINDLAMSGAQPLGGLTAGFIIEEGLELEVLGPSLRRWARRPLMRASAS